MYKKDFDNLLKTKIPQAVFLYGECDFLIDYYGKTLRKLIVSQYSADEYKFYFDEYNPKTIREMLSQQSLFATSSLVITKINKLKDSSKKKGGDIASFLHILSLNTTNYLIIEFYSDGDYSSYMKQAKSASALFNTTNFVNVRFFNPNQKEALEILWQYVKELGINITQNSLLYLYDVQNNQIGLCVNELHKFALLSSEITKSDIDKLSYGLYTNTIEELCESLLDNGECLKIIANIEEEGIQDVYLITMIQSYFYRLFLFFSYIKTNGRFNSLEILGYALPRNIEEKYARYAMKLRESQYLEIFKALSDWRLDVISGRNKNYFTSLIKIQAIIK